MEFNLGGDADGMNGHKAGTTKSTGHKAAAGRDELVEMRFYIPGTIARKPEDEGDVDGAEDEEYDQQNAANHFYDTLIDKAQIGEVAGDTFATFLDILHLTPRYAPAPAMGKTILTASAEDASISICTRIHSDYEAKHTTTKFNIKRSRNSSYYRSPTKRTLSSLSV